MTIFITEAANRMMQQTADAFSLILNERERQQTQEGHTPAHDDEHTEGQLALLAAAYALESRRSLLPMSRRSLEGEGRHRIKQVLDLLGWPFKPKDPIRDLVRAGALILAELERRLRAQEQTPESKDFLDRESYIAHLKRLIEKLEAENAGQLGAIKAANDKIIELSKALGKEKDQELPCSKPQPPLPRWQSHKIVEADKITHVAGDRINIKRWVLACGVIIDSPPVSRVPDGVNPLGGYCVRYEDGFESWSPSEAFEKGYTRLS